MTIVNVTPVIAPGSGGRLTLTSATPALTSTVSGATTVYFTPYRGNAVPIWNGTIFVPTVFTELSQATTDSTKSPAAVAATKVYDIFVWSDSGTLRATRGPAWSTSTSRGTGAGTSQLSLTNGYYVNTVSITNGPAAGYGTYAGSIGSNSSSTIDFILGGSASGGTAAVLNVWNNFNRVMVYAASNDNGTSYTYTSSTVRQARASTGNQLNFLSGLAEDAISTAYFTSLSTTANVGSNQFFGIGIDSITIANAAETTAQNLTTASALVTQTTCSHLASPQLGSHYFSAVEASDNSHANTFDAFSNAGLSMQFLM